MLEILAFSLKTWQKSLQVVTVNCSQFKAKSRQTDRALLLTTG